jgi:hypothetical protein
MNEFGVVVEEAFFERKSRRRRHFKHQRQRPFRQEGNSDEENLLFHFRREMIIQAVLVIHGFGIHGFDYSRMQKP